MRVAAPVTFEYPMESEPNPKKHQGGCTDGFGMPRLL